MTNKRKKLIIFMVITLIILILLLLVLKNRQNTQEIPKAEIERASNEAEKKEKDAVLEKLYSMKEQDRINYYCAEFFKLIDKEQYEKAYSLLYSEYKENYFPTLASFKRYFEDYFPDDITLNFSNIERLGDIYVLWVDVNDTLNGKDLGHNFSMNVVIKENDYNDYVLSFSRNSAVEEN